MAGRPGSAREGVLDTVQSIGGAPGARPAEKVKFLEMPLSEISSSEARRRAARGEPIEDLVGQDVAAYISEHGLYRPAGRARG